MEYILYHSADFIKQHNSIYIEHTVVEQNSELHTPPYMMLIYVAHGTGEYCISGKYNEVTEGDIILINPNTPNRFCSSVSDKALSMYCCSFFPNALPHKINQYTSDFPELKSFFDNTTPYLHIKDTNQKDIRNLMIRILDDFTYSQPGYEHTIKYLLTVTLTNIFRIHTVNHNRKNPLNSNYIIGDATNYINRNIYSKLSLNDLAQKMHLTPQYLCRAFKKYVNMTFMQFVNQLRVEKIKDELEHTDRPLFIIYADFDLTPQYINRMFKKYTGYSLSEYKKKFNYKIDNPLYKT